MYKNTVAHNYKTGVISTDHPRGQQTKKIDKAELKKDLARRRDRDRELVVGVFKNLETPGGSVRFAYKRYADDPFDAYELYDGETYQLPRCVARHLNNNCFYMEYKHLNGQNGETGMRTAYNDGRLNAESMQAARKVHRFAFMSLDYMEDDIDMLPSKAVYKVGTPDQNLDIKS